VRGTSRSIVAEKEIWCGFGVSSGTHPAEKPPQKVFRSVAGLRRWIGTIIAKSPQNGN
jgi:hypothetical protein